MRQIIRHFTDDDLYKFTMCCAVIDNYPRTQVRYRFTDRDNTIYPPGFAALVEEQIAMLESVVITDAEIDFMRRRCNYIPNWFYSYLKGFRYDRRWVKVRQDEQGHLSIEFEGCWSDTILLEVKVLAIVSELYYIVTGEDSSFDYEDFAERSGNKAARLIGAGCQFSDMGTRRRASFRAQDTAIRAMAECDRHIAGSGHFVGTSNVYFAMKYDLTPIGTMAHEFVCAIAGMYGPLMANHIAMTKWSDTYRGALGTYLYDTYGWRIFSLNFSEDFANLFKGLRIDSGDNIEQLDMIVDKYRSLNIDSRTKQIIFSNALDVDRAINIHHYASSKCLPSFGIGTHFTNDFPGVRPRNIVIKLTDVKITESWPFYSPTCKLSEDKGKYTGDEATVRRFMEILHINPDGSTHQQAEKS
ncbi:nicotinate phosphoribosyltransferase [uncultured Duncaniella sp.]|uniref:nicotinate phosphoribosyltransferase n=1 Tax=uncultured Duncaniella sp. TaxID=2768039 RepID=UPI00260D0620|nr:nicotinate phosphoribosyltransferase [uncultured Duncaniella sp.]